MPDRQRQRAVTAKRVQWFCGLGLALFLPDSMPAQDAGGVGPTVRARLRTGGTVTTRFVQTYAGPGQIPPARTADVPLSNIERIDFPHRSIERLDSAPPRIVTLWTGESFVPSTYDIRPPARNEAPRLRVNWRYPGGQSMLLDCVESVRAPRFARDFESTRYTVRVPDGGNRRTTRHLKPTLGWSFTPAAERFLPGSTAEVILPRPESSVVADIRLSFGSDAVGDDRTITIHFLLQDGSTEHEVAVHFARHSYNRLHCWLTSDIPMSSRRFVVAQWTHIRFFLDDSLTVTESGRLLGSAARVRGTLRAVRVEVSPGGFYPSELRLEPAWFRVRRSADAHESHPSRLTPVRDAPSILMTGGDEIFGKAITSSSDVRLVLHRDISNEHRDWNPLSHDVARLVTPRGPVFIAWPDIAALRFRHSSQPIVGRLPQQPTAPGWIADVTLVPETTCARFGEPGGGRLRGVVYGTNGQSLHLSHPLLGPIHLPWRSLQRMELFSHGTLRMLDAGPRHLGNGIREQFSSPEPVGTEWTLKWKSSRKSDPARPVYLTADVAELIPSGPDTLAATRYLDEVRSGFLCTRVEVNGNFIGTLNDQLSSPVPANAPRRIRLRIPHSALNATGVNTLTFRQTPSRDDAASYDDCEIRSIAIEEEFPPPDTDR